MHHIYRDLRFLARLARQKPAFYVLLTAMLTLGIGTTTATFTLTRAVLFTPLPYQQPDDLVVIGEFDRRDQTPRKLSPPVFALYAALLHDAAAWWRFDINLDDATGLQPERLAGAEITANLFSVLGTGPLPGYDLPEGPRFHRPEPHVFISYRLWQSRYAGRAVTGEHIDINGRSSRIAGVMPDSFRFPNDDVDVWMVITWNPRDRTRYAFFLHAVGRLHASDTFDQAKARFAAASRSLKADVPDTHSNIDARPVPLTTHVHGRYVEAFRILLVTVLALLLLINLNVASLLLMRAHQRHREMGIRIALGASPASILRMTMIEGVAVSVVALLPAGALAVTLARAVTSLTVTPIPRLSEVSLNLPVLLFCAAITGTSTLLFSILPAFSHLRGSVVRQAPAIIPRRRKALTLLQTALAVALIHSAAVALTLVRQQLDVDPGFQPADTITVPLELTSARAPEWADVGRKYSNLISGIAATGIHDVALANFLPPESAWPAPYTVGSAGDPDAGSDVYSAQYVTVSEGYFRALGIPLRTGRTFGTHDHPLSQWVVVVNRAFVRRHWSSDVEAIGQIFKAGTSGFGPLGRSLNPTGRYRIVGVVGDAANGGLHVTEPAVYFTVRQFPYRAMTVVAAGGPDLAGTIERQIRELDPAIPPGRTGTMRDRLRRETARERFTASVMVAFAAFGLLIAATGVLSVLAGTAVQRSRELFIRSSIGATPFQLQRLLILDGLQPALLGLVCGMVVAFWLEQHFRPSGFSFAPTAFSAFVLAAVALPATVLPAIKTRARYESIDRPPA